MDIASRNPSESEKPMLTKALIINAVVLFAVLEADLGPARKLTRFRLMRPLLTCLAIVPLFLEALATHGTGLALEIGGGVAGALLGLLSLKLITVYRDRNSGRIVTRAGFGYAALWIAVIAARSAFSIGSQDWFNHSLSTWCVNHQVTGNAITDGLIIMAVCMSVARSLGLTVRSYEVGHRSSVAPIAA
jgi:hypothetical protein